MDHKRAAAGDPEENHLQTRSEQSTMTQNERQQVSLDFAAEVLDQLEKFTLQKITDGETRADWIERLSRVHRWRLLRLSSFTGRLEQVWKFFEDQKQDYRTGYLDNFIKSLPEPKTGIGKDCMEYINKITKEEYAHSPAGDQLEREFVNAMRLKYPSVTWACRRPGNIKK